MTVFITGATGYVGYPVALAFRDAGYKVIGLCRSEESAGKLGSKLGSGRTFGHLKRGRVI